MFVAVAVLVVTGIVDIDIVDVLLMVYKTEHNSIRQYQFSVRFLCDDGCRQTKSIHNLDIACASLCVCATPYAYSAMTTEDSI